MIRLDHGGLVNAVAVRTDGKRFASAAERSGSALNGEGTRRGVERRSLRELVAERERDLSFTKSEVVTKVRA